MQSLLPKDWRRRREAPPRMGRFEVEGSRGNWDVIDWAYATVIHYDRKEDAEDTARFAREYVKRHGDIDFAAFPYALDEPLYYDDVEAIRHFWEVEYP